MTSRVLHRSGAIPPTATGGDGIYLHLADGTKIIDGSGGAAVACLGHGNQRIAAAIGRQAATMAYAHTGTFISQPAEDLAHIVLDGEPGGLTHAYFCSSGSEGTEAALKLARQYFVEIGQPRRTRFIARRQGYHGNTLGALAAGGNMMRRALYEPMLAPAFSLVSPCFAYRFKRDDETDAQYVDRLADELEAEFQRLGPDTVIAFIAEPVVGATTGCVAALPGYFQRMREICDRHGALLILDEVMCGMGRTGTMHAWEQEGIAPDLQVVAKGLGGGYQPIGGVLIGGRIVECDRRRLGRLHARPHLSGASGRLRRRTGGAAHHPRGQPAGERPRHGRAAGDRADRTLRQPSPCRRRARPRPVLGAGVRDRPRDEAGVRPDAENQRTGEARGAGARAGDLSDGRHDRRHGRATTSSSRRPTSPPPPTSTRSSIGSAPRWIAGPGAG